MRLDHLTRLLTALALLATVGAAACFLLGWLSPGPLRDAIAAWGLPLLTLPAILVMAVAYLRQITGEKLLARQQLAAAVAYCLPRATPSLTVGRVEAARNRFVAAEALRQQGQPRDALALLDAPNPLSTSSHPELHALLMVARVAALWDTHQPELARELIERLRGAPLPPQGRALLASLVDREPPAAGGEPPPDPQSPAQV